MPELPEVEHITRYLTERIRGRRITGVRLLDSTARRRRSETRHLGLDALVGARVKRIRRRAKLIFFDLGPAPTLVFHLKLTGKLWVEPTSRPASRWTRLALALGKDELRFEDTRRLGWFDLLDEDAERTLIAPLGPEPLEPTWTLAVLKATLARRRGPVKVLLLDPEFVAGVGNIYADEILHAARLHPLARGEDLDARAVGRLHRATRAVLARAVAERTGAPSQSRVGQGTRGASRELRLAVFQRTGERCPRCRTPIVRIVVRGRGTHLCPRCQPPPRGAERPRPASQHRRSPRAPDR